MPCFVTVRKTNGQTVTINVGLIEWWRPEANGRGAAESTAVAYKGGFAHVAMNPEDFADLIRQANADVVESK